MLGTLVQFARQVRQPTVAALAAAAIALPALSTSSAARGPETIADVSEKVIDAVVNVSTSQKVETRNSPMPQLPNDPQLDELFRDFFNRRGQGDPQNRERGPRRVNSLGSGFIIDPSGIIVTNNHVISEATRSPSFSTTARGSRPRSSAGIRRPTSPCCGSSRISRSRR